MTYSTPKVSIIVPVYKAEKYINKCLDSIKAQTFVDWECILVDDGSPDASGEICDMYASEDSRFKVIHKKNEGVSMARKDGMDAAIGDYSIHIDPDDWVEPNMLEEMYNEIVRLGVDVLVVNYYNETPSGSQSVNKQPFAGSNIHELANDILLQRLHGSLCNKLLRQACYRDCTPHFYKEVRYCEDELIWFQLAKFNLSVGYLDKAYYHYVWREDSICHSGDLIKDYSLNLKYLKLMELPEDLISQRSFRFGIWLLNKQMMTKQVFDYFCSNLNYPDVKGKLGFQDNLFFRYAMNGHFKFGKFLFSCIQWPKLIIKKIIGRK